MDVCNPFYAQETFIEPKIFEKYGVKNVMHIPEFAEKAVNNSYKKWKTITINDKHFKLQGYEHLGLELLLHTFSEDEIWCNKAEMPCLWYEWNGVNHRYYPDFFIPSLNLIFEVKSEYTYYKDLDRNMLKKRCSEEAGYGFQFLVFNEASHEAQFLAFKEKNMFYNNTSLNDIFNSIDNIMNVASSRNSSNMFPFYNIKTEDNKTFTIEFAVAGYGKNDIEIEVNGSTLRIKGQTQPSDDNFIYKGITTKPFEKLLKLASGIEVTGADLSNGMLQIFLEKAAEFNSKKIDIGDQPKRAKKTAKLLTEDPEDRML